MDSDHSQTDASSYPEATIEGARCYVELAPVVDVMFDQLEYLLNHQGDQCTQECTECQRLEQVQDWLLLPFRAPTRTNVSALQAAAQASQQNNDGVWPGVNAFELFDF